MERRAPLIALTVAVAVTVCGCTTAGGHPAAAAKTSAASAPAAPSLVSTPSSTPSPSGTPIDPITFPPTADRGPRPGAEGTVIRDSAGDPITYVVASGDTTWNIATRFGVSVDDMMDRANVGYSTLYPGEKLSLVW